MPSLLILNLTALAALVPAAILPWRWRSDRPDVVFWAVMAVAVAGPLAATLGQLGDGWSRGLGLALWLSISASAAAFLFAAVFMPQAWRLASLLLPYLLCLAALGTVWSVGHPGGDPMALRPEAWLLVHIAISIATYALATLAAVAAAAVFLQERALKKKRPSGLTALLPSIADAERLQFNMLAAAETVLAFGILTGIAQSLVQSGAVPVDHKTTLSLLAFAVIAVLLFLQARTGLRGRRSGRLVLVAYLLLTLAYPGVKFVTDVLIG
jgi:ABC-type uncharacterized transport system permease subunit